MKLLYWNVNGLRAVEKKNCLRPLISATNPDIIGIQEIKAKPEQLDFVENVYPDYFCYWNSAQKPGYSGTGLLIKKEFCEINLINISTENINIGIPNSEQFNDDIEGRCQCFSFNIASQKYAVLNIYFPNGGKSEQAWLDKLKFYQAMLNYVNELRSQNKIVIWGGDVNCAHHEIDLARPKDNEGAIGFRPEERAWLSNWLDEGWVDIFRAIYPDKIIYSWWHLVTRARERNIGWRIDYAFTDKNNFKNINQIEYLNEIYGSDHCPLLLNFLTN